MRITRRTITAVVAAALAVGGVAYVLRPEVLEVDVGQVARGPMRVTVDAEARTRVVDRYVLTAPVGGRLRRVAIAEGAPVQRGQVVAWIAPLPLDVQSTTQGTARLHAAQALAREAATRVGQARATLDQARRATERASRLAEAGAIAPAALEAAETEQRLHEEEFSGALSRARAAAADVESARAALLASGSYASGDASRDAVAVRAPAAGNVLRIPERSERIVAAGTPVLEVGDTRTLEVVTDVLSTDAVRIRPGAEVEIVHWGGDSPLRARVRAVEPAGFTRVSALGVEEQRVNIIADLPSPPPTLGDGYRVEVRIVVWRADDVLTVPASTLFQHQGGWHVFVVDDGRARLRAVELGQRGGANVQIVGGLDEGTQVILFPSDRLQDGVRVR